jgi:hypothetical protein
MAVQIRLRRGTAAEWSGADPSPILAEGEVGVETDTSKLKIGDGVTSWATLPYQGAGTVLDVSTVEKGGVVVGSAAGTVAILPVGANGTVLGVDSSDPTTVGWVTFNLNALSDVTLTSPVSGDLLQFNGSAWVNVTDFSVLTANRDALVALAWGAQAGYFSSQNSTTVYKWAFPSDTVTTTTAAPNTGLGTSGFANAAVAGYFGRSADMYKYLFPSDSATITTAPPSTLESDNASFANPFVAGYSSRGNSNTTVYKWAFPADTVSTTTAAPASMQEHSGFSNFGVAGYMCRAADSGGSATTTVYKWAFPADTVSTTTAAPEEMKRNGGFANPAVAGYFSQGVPDKSESTTIYKWAFPADTVSTTTAAPDGMDSHSGFANPAVAGYFNRSNNTTTVYKWAFPADTVSTTTAVPDILGLTGGFANGY